MKGNVDRIKIVKGQLEIQLIFLFKNFSHFERERGESSIILGLTSLITTIKESTKICVLEALRFFWSHGSISV